MIYILQQLIIINNGQTLEYDTTMFGSYKSKSTAKLRFQKIINNVMVSQQFNFEGTNYQMPKNCQSRVTDTLALYFTDENDFRYELSIISTNLK